MNLAQFTGTENYWRSNKMFAPNMVHTDGVQYFIEQAHAYWFLDFVAITVFPLLKQHPFLSVQLLVKDDSTATITVEDGNSEPLMTEEIDYTDCPSGEYHFFLTDNVFLLTNEY